MQRANKCINVDFSSRSTSNQGDKLAEELSVMSVQFDYPDEHRSHITDLGSLLKSMHDRIKQLEKSAHSSKAGG